MEADEIRALRKTLGMTAKEFAAQIGVIPVTNVYHLEKGVRRPSPTVRKLLSELSERAERGGDGLHPALTRPEGETGKPEFPPQRIKAVRLALRMSQADLATELGLKTKGHVSRLEKEPNKNSPAGCKPTAAQLIVLRRLAQEAGL